MNANELADELDVESSQAEYGYVVDNWKLFRGAAAMLRQQQAEIEALKERLCAYEYDDDEPLKETRPFTPEEVDYLRKWAMEGDLKNAKTLLEKSGYKVQEPNK